MQWPDSNLLNYDFDGLNRVYQIRENGTSPVIVGYGYDPESRLMSVTRGNGTSSSLHYDLASRLQTLSHTMASQSESVTFGYTPASQLQTRTGSNTSYDYTPGEGSRAYAANGLNEYANVGGTAYSNDARGNLTSDGTRTLTYDLENHLLSVTGGAGLTLQYDPLGRIWQTTSGSAVTQFLYDGQRLVGEYSSSGTVLQRYAHGPKTDDPEVWYQGSAMTTREWLHTDERGSVVATTDSTGTPTIYTYGPFGEPTPGWTGSRFRYTGQITLPEAQLYHYKARVYDPGLGRFFQTDPIGTKDDLDLYAYVYNDPTDKRDTTGLESEQSGPTNADSCTGTRIGSGCGSGYNTPGTSTTRTPAPVYGKPQTTGTPGHAETMQARADADKLRSDAKRVHMNQTLRTVSDGKIDSDLKPDNAVVREDGKIDIHETLSRSQFKKPEKVEAKYRNALPESMRGNVTSARPSMGPAETPKGPAILMGIQIGVQVIEMILDANEDPCRANPDICT